MSSHIAKFAHYIELVVSEESDEDSERSGSVTKSRVPRGDQRKAGRPVLLSDLGFAAQAGI